MGDGGAIGNERLLRLRAGLVVMGGTMATMQDMSFAELQTALDREMARMYELSKQCSDLGVDKTPFGCYSWMQMLVASLCVNQGGIVCNIQRRLLKAAIASK